MSDFLANVSGGTALTSALSRNENITDLRPFGQEIYLTSCIVAGSYYVEDFFILLMKLEHGDRLVLVREPDNKYDTYAIRIQNAEGKKLGYVPRTMNHIPARLMDAGKVIYAKVAGLDTINDTLRIGIYMED